MRFFFREKDGGPESTVTGYWLIEAKSLFSIVLLRFDRGSRPAYHTHAFHSVSWLLRGALREFIYPNTDGGSIIDYSPSFRPILTLRTTYHKVLSYGTSWVLSFRGPWADKWLEYRLDEARQVTLTHGRKEVTT